MPYFVHTLYTRVCVYVCVCLHCIYIKGGVVSFIKRRKNATRSPGERERERPKKEKVLFFWFHDPGTSPNWRPNLLYIYIIYQESRPSSMRRDGLLNNLFLLIIIFYFYFFFRSLEKNFGKSEAFYYHLIFIFIIALFTLNHRISNNK